MHDAAAWVIVNVRPAMVSVPVRTEVVELAATLYGTVPFPVPPVAPVNVIQPAFEVADQVQPVPAVTPTLPVAPAAPTDCPVALSDGAHAGWNENPFDRELAVEPPGPTAVTRASNTTPGRRHAMQQRQKIDADDAAARRRLPKVHGVDRDRRPDDVHGQRVPLHERCAVTGVRIVIGRGRELDVTGVDDRLRRQHGRRRDDQEKDERVVRHAKAAVSDHEGSSG